MNRHFLILSLVLSLAMSSAATAEDLVLVAGATGQTGRHVVESLLEKGYTVRAMSRSAERAASLADNIEGVAADVTKPETLGPVMEGATIVISAIGARWPIGANGFEAVDFKGNRALIDAAKAAVVKQFLVVTGGSAGFDDFLHTLSIAPYPWKAKAEAHLRASGLTYTILAPGGLTDEPAGALGVRMAPRTQYESGMIARADVADVIVASIGNQDAFNKTITLVNDEALTPGDWMSGFSDLPMDEAE